MKNTVWILTLIGCLQLSSLGADNAAKEAIKFEERMREEKKREEERAKEYATRVKVARFDSVWRSPRAEDIDVVQAGEETPKTSKAIALLTFEGEAQEETQAVAGLIAKAKELGADAVIMKYFDPQKETVTPGIRRIYRANAVVYKQPK